MTLLADKPAGIERILECVEDAHAMRAVRTSDLAATIWNRELPRDVLKWLAGIDPTKLPRGRIVSPIDAVGDAVHHLFEAAELANGPERHWLQQDIADLAMAFSGIMQTPFLRLRLDVVTGNACRRFHVDAVMARLVCTYRGTGTQYGVTQDGHEPAQVFTVRTGAPIVLRGSLWAVEPPSGLVHRSPPIEGTGETRLVLVLDPVFDLEDEV